MEPFEMEEHRQAAHDRRMESRPKCDDCGKLIQTQYCVRKDSGEYICWNCLNDRRVDTAEEFDLEGPEWD